ncbi:MAG: sigma-70 family RNA polymerase sigma factor [Gammaproteobacteria bacterium]|nr:sigma-70 family RNA polymerase sigma factor [Gammaproteobacteria bacterium]
MPCLVLVASLNLALEPWALFYQTGRLAQQLLGTIRYNSHQFRRQPRETVSDVQAVAEVSPERDAVALESTERLNSLIAALPNAQREALIMHKEAGLTIREIARVTGITEEGVKSRLRYAMAKLRRGMRDYV